MARGDVTLWLAMVMLALAAPPSAAQDVSKAAALIESCDYAAARAELASPVLREDAEALMLLARMSAAGQGGPVDPVGAYRDFTLVYMLGEPDPRAQAAFERRQVARDMTRDQILAGERAVIDWLDAGIGADARVARVNVLVSTLQACLDWRESCDEAVPLTFALGPAAVDAVPKLERMMTADPMWMSRVDYVYALTAIGTPAVPTLCRVLLDRQQFDVEGPWNATYAAEGLGLLGPTAREALPCLLEGLTATYAPIPDLASRLGDDMGINDADTMLDMRLNLAHAIIQIRDPDRVVHDGLIAAGQQAPDSMTPIILSWVLGLTYNEPETAIVLAPSVLAGTGSQEKMSMIYVLLDLSAIPGFAAKAQGLIPMLREIEATGPEDLRGIAGTLVAAITQPE